MARPTNWREIVAAAALRNKMSDPRLLFALLEAENGADGMEFKYGVQRKDPKNPKSPLWVPNPAWRGFTAQAGAAAFQIQREEEEYQKETGRSAMWNGLYSDEFLRYFSQGGSELFIGPPEQADRGFPKDKLYEGYAPVGAANDPFNLNINHLPNLKSAYSEMSRDARTGEVVPYEPREKPPMGALPPWGDPLDAYAMARVQENELGEIEKNLGRQQAAYMRGLLDIDLAEAARSGQRLTQPLTTYLSDKIGDGLALLAKGGRLARGVLAGRPGDELEAPELTGLENEPIEHSPVELLSGGVLGAIVNYPHRAANFGVDIATDPVNTLAGAGAVAGLATRAIKGVKTVGEFAKAGKAGVKGAEGVGQAGEVADTTTLLPKGVSAETAQATTPGVPVAPPAPVLPATSPAGPGGPIIPGAAGTKLGTPIAPAAPIAPEGAGVKPPAPPAPAAPPPPPPPIPSPVAGITQDELDNLLKSVQATISEARKSDTVISAEATALLDSGTVTLKKLLKGEVRLDNAGALQAVQSIRQRWMKKLDELMLDDTPRTAQEDRKFRQLLNVTANLDKRVRAPGEIPSGQMVRAAIYGQGPSNKALEETLEYAQIGAPVEQLVYTYRLLRGAKEKDAFMKGFRTFGQKLKAGAMSIMLGGLVSATSTPIWNGLSAASLTTAKVFERWRMSRYVDSNVMPGEATVLAQSLMMAYPKVLFGDREVSRRFYDSWRSFKGLTRGAGPDSLTPLNTVALQRLEELPREMAKHLGVGKDGKTFIKNEPAYNALAEELATLRANTGVGGINKLQAKRSISSEMYGATGLWGAAIDALGHASMLGVYAVGATDNLFRFAVQTAWSDALAHRLAFQEAFTAVKSAGEVGDPKRLRAFSKDLKADPVRRAAFLARKEEFMAHPQSTFVPVAGKMTSIDEVGKNEADLIAMMSPLEGAIGKIDEATRQSLIWRTFQPYFKVSMLTAREGGNRLPLIRRLLPSVNADMAAGGERAAKAKAQLATGWAIAGIATGLSLSNRCDGFGPLDRDARQSWEQAGHKSYTCRVGSQFIPYDRTGAIGNVFAFMLDVNYMLPRLDTVAPEADESLGQALATELVEAMTVAATHLIINNATSGDFRDFMAALAEGDGAADKLSAIMARKTPGFIPASALGRQINSMIEGELKAADSAYDRALKSIPGMASNLPAYRTYWGEKDEVPNEGAWENFLTIGGVQTKPFHPDDPRVTLDAEMGASRVYFSAPGKVQGGVHLNIHQRMRLRELFGKGIYDGTTLIGMEAPDMAQAHHPRGHSLASGLWEIIHGKPGEGVPIEWARGKPGPDGGRQALVQRYVTRVKDAAFQQLLNEDHELFIQVLNKKGFKAIGAMSEEDVQQAIQADRQRQEQQGVILGR